MGFQHVTFGLLAIDAMADQQRQDVEFGRRKMEFVSSFAAEATLQIDLQSAGGYHGFGGTIFRDDTAKHGPQSCGQFAEAEGLSDVVFVLDQIDCARLSRLAA